MMKNDKQMLDMLRNEFEKSSESAKVPLRLQKESMVAMLKKEASKENNSQKETDFSVKTGTKNSKITNLRKYGAIAALFAIVVFGASMLSSSSTTIARADDFSSQLKDQLGELLVNPESFDEIKIISAHKETPDQPEQPTNPAVNPTDTDSEKLPSINTPEIIVSIFGGYQSADSIKNDVSNTAENPATTESADNFSSANTVTGETEVIPAQSDVEADIIKSSGKYLYILTTTKDNVTGNITEKIQIVEKIGSGNEMSTLSYITLCENVVAGAYEECIAIQIYENTLIAILQRKDFDTESKTIAKYYNINNPEEPFRTHVQDGKYFFSSINGSNFCLITDKSEEGKDYSVVPAFSVDGVRTELTTDDVFIPQTTPEKSYHFITVTDVANPESPVGYLATAGTGNRFQYFESAIVITREWVTIAEKEGEPNGSLTEIYRFNYDNSSISKPLTNAVEGSVIGSYINPKNDSLMIAADVTGSNRIYVLDKSMESVNKFEDILPGKKIDSVKFIGQNVYLTAGSETTILNFSIPKVSTNLGTTPAKLFEGNLYEISDSKLLDICTDENGFVAFRILDLNDLEHSSDAAKYVPEEKYNILSSLDSRSIMVIPQKEMFGVPAVVSDAEAGAEYSAYMIFDVSDGEIKLVGICRHDEFYVGDAAVRAVYDNGTIYTVSGEKISAFSAETFEKIAKHEII